MLTKICIRCRKDLPIEKFHRCSQGRPGYNSYCKECNNKNTNKNRLLRKATVDGYLKLLYWYTKRRAKDKKLDRDLSWEFLLDLYKNQNGLCAISKVPMTTESGVGNVATNISLDRIDSSKGYTKDNVQLVCHIVNRMKQEQTQESFIKWCKIIAEIS